MSIKLLFLHIVFNAPKLTQVKPASQFDFMSLSIKFTEILHCGMKISGKSEPFCNLPARVWEHFVFALLFLPAVLGEYFNAIFRTDLFLGFYCLDEIYCVKM